MQQYTVKMVTDGVCAVIAEVLECDATSLTPETYVFRDLETESIDLLEYGIGLGRLFGVRVRDDVMFLKDFRMQCSAQGSEAERMAVLQAIYPHLSKARLHAMVQDIAANPKARPVLQIHDIAAYILHAMSPR